MKLLKTTIFLSTFFSLTAFAEIQYPNSLGAEIGIMYVAQNAGQNTTTVLPMINYKALAYGNMSLSAQAGFTGYKDAQSGNVRSIFVVRLNPEYKISDSDFSVEGLIGIQQWESRGAEADFGLRVNYSSDIIKNMWIDEAFAGGGRINHVVETNYFTLGVKKWF